FYGSSSYPFERLRQAKAEVRDERAMKASKVKASIEPKALHWVSSPILANGTNYRDIFPFAVGLLSISSLSGQGASTFADEGQINPGFI
ncbi:MAG: hypothetical protein ACYTX0_56580, partial [Nostoc sp.]